MKQTIYLGIALLTALLLTGCDWRADKSTPYLTAQVGKTTLTGCNWHHLNATANSVFNENFEYFFVHSNGTLEYGYLRNDADASMKLWRNYTGDLCIITFDNQRLVNKTVEA